MNEKFDEAALASIYEEMKRAAMKAKLFVVDGYSRSSRCALDIA